MPDRVGHDDGKVGHPSGSFLSFHLFVEVSDEVQDLGKKVEQGTFGRLEALRVGKPCQLVQVVAQARQIAEDGVMFLYEVLHDLGIDRCLPDIFGQCAESRRPRPVTDDVILQGAVSYGHGPALLLHPAGFRVTAFVLLFHCSILCDCQEQSEATNWRFSASENTTSLTSLSFGINPLSPLS